MLSCYEVLWRPRRRHRLVVHDPAHACMHAFLTINHRLPGWARCVRSLTWTGGSLSCVYLHSMAEMQLLMHVDVMNV
jgi:hypothetical protein